MVREGGSSRGSRGLADALPGGACMRGADQPSVQPSSSRSGDRSGGSALGVIPEPVFGFARPARVGPQRRQSGAMGEGL